MFFKRKLPPFHKKVWEDDQQSQEIQYDSYRPQAISPTSNKFYEYMKKAQELDQE